MVVKDLTTLKAIAKKYHLDFCSIYKYYEGNAYKNGIGQDLPNFFTNRGRVFKLVYQSGCFNPFLVELNAKDVVFDKETKEPSFMNYPNPKWDTNRYYTI